MAQSVLLVFCSNGDKRLSVNMLPPLGVLSIASFLEEKGIHTDVLDLSVDPKGKIDPEPYDLVGFSVNIANRKSSFQTIADIKRDLPDKQIVVGGPLAMSNPELFMRARHVDAVFACEGEEALLEYMRTDNKEDVRGLYLRNGPEYHFTGSRDWIRDLDALPIPAFHKVDLGKYNSLPKKRRPIASILTSRGCPYSCIFCSHAMGRKWRPRSPENVVQEITCLVHEHGVKEICIYDDNFSLNKERARTICSLLTQEKVKVTLQFSNGLRADSIDAEMLEALKRAGTWLIGLAPETGNPDVMKKIRKGFDHSQVLKIRKECRNLGIKTFGFFMIGFPFETRKEINDTIRFAKELDCEMVEFNKVIPYAGTELHDLIVNGGYLLRDALTEVESYHEGGITTHKVGDLKPDEVKDMIREAYRKYYLRPGKALDLLQTFSMRDLFELGKYAIRTGNI